MHVLVLGSGQLARMMSLAGAPLNIEISAFDVNTQNVVHPLTQAVIGHGLEQAIAGADVITAEFEHIPHDVLAVCERSGKFLPSTDAIKAGGDRRLEKALLDNAGVRNAKYAVITNRAEFEAAIDYVGIPMVLKTALGGYDGKGQWRLKTSQDSDAIWLIWHKHWRFLSNRRLWRKNSFPLIAKCRWLARVEKMARSRCIHWPKTYT